MTHDRHPAQASCCRSQTFTATNPQNNVQATVTELKKGWGASIDVSVVGVTEELAGPSCQLIAVGPDGKTDVAASWSAPAAGYTGVSRVNASGSTAIAVKDITRVQGRRLRRDNSGLGARDLVDLVARDYLLARWG